jgi:hypothetical protein
MIEYQLSTPEGSVRVVLNSRAPNTPHPIAYEGNPAAIALVREWLESEYGAFGHFVGDATTPIDLAVAMAHDRAKPFAPKLLRGEELIQPVELDLPDDAVT